MYKETMSIYVTIDMNQMGIGWVINQEGEDVQ